MVSPVLLTLQLALPSLSHLSQDVLEGGRTDAGGGGGGCLPVLDTKNDKSIRCELASDVTVSVTGASACAEEWRWVEEANDAAELLQQGNSRVCLTLSGSLRGHGRK
jgi:hypothetical protein